ncbi:hypothetical protein F4859DRAFT_146187 [Xylaria cf. heliscus]|nr:hypothetical protein F4859DRAFT_146187 [Xylaria cf. heliscus]
MDQSTLNGSLPSSAMRWADLKPIIKKLFIDDNRTLDEIVGILRTEYNFEVNVDKLKHRVYRMHWGIKKSMSSAQKEQLINDLLAHPNESLLAGLSDTVVRKLVRHLRVPQNETSRDHPSPTISMFSYLNSLHNVLKSLRTNVVPFLGSEGPLLVRRGLAPLRKELRLRARTNRSRLLISGRLYDMVRTLNLEERRILSIWVGQLKVFMHKTAKNWGRGPRTWTADLLEFDHNQCYKLMSSHQVLPDKPIALNEVVDPAVGGPKAEEPPQLCRNLCPWMIHCSSSRYAQLIQWLPDQQTVAQPSSLDQSVAQSQPHGSSRTFNSASQSPPGDKNCTDTWKDEPCFSEVCGRAIAEHSFSTIPGDDLPFSLLEFEHCQPDFLDSLSLAITAGSKTLLEQLVLSNDVLNVDLSSISPFHLAASYLNSSKACCEIFEALVCLPNTRRQLSRLYVSGLGHTVLDSLLVTILKSHSALPPEMVEDEWRECGFPGADVDICGRWEFDTPEVFARVCEGAPLVPFNWKHKFCHSSVQAICHSIRTLFSFFWSPDVNTLSGLFLRRCGNCFHELRLGPLHALVVTAAYLVQYGCRGEDLFGIVACGLSLLTSGADPTLQASVSIRDLYSQAPRNMCAHEELTPSEFARKVEPIIFKKQLSQELKAGWELLCYILHDHRKCDSDSGIKQCQLHVDEHPLPIVWDDNLADLWAAVQAEFLSYRRSDEHDQWLSEKFYMQAWLGGHKTGPVRSDYLKDGVLKAHCSCGRFNTSSWRNERIEDLYGDDNRLRYTEPSWYISDKLFEEAAAASDSELSR